MAKESFYFSHDYNARNDDKILELRSEFGAEGYGVFWMIIETMAENENGGTKATLLGGLSVSYGVAKGRLLEIIDRCLEVGLFYKEGDMIFSKRLLKHKYIRKNLSESGKKGAELRWGGNSQPIAPLSPTHSTPNGKTMLKERKGKEIYDIGPDENFITDLEAYLKTHEKDYEVLKMDGLRENIDVTRALKKYHLHCQEKGKYPAKPLQLISGFKLWLMNEKDYFFDKLKKENKPDINSAPPLKTLK